MVRSVTASHGKALCRPVRRLQFGADAIFYFGTESQRDSFIGRLGLKNGVGVDAFTPVPGKNNMATSAFGNFLVGKFQGAMPGQSAEPKSGGFPVLVASCTQDGRWLAQHWPKLKTIAQEVQPGVEPARYAENVAHPFIFKAGRGKQQAVYSYHLSPDPLGGSLTLNFDPVTFEYLPSKK